MKSKHTIIINDARNLVDIKSESVELIVTSPPYPMIEMWDELFSILNPFIGYELKNKNGNNAFLLMHKELDKVWKECYRVLKPGCLACINIGDAVRTIDGEFRMYSNHAKIINSLYEIGFVQLPDILWRKQTNAPNKFMGSGMLPSCAYVTYEHEYILIFRKGGKRKFIEQNEKENRRKSAFYWEERNIWFSDVWTDLKGTSQQLCNKSARDRSAAYPFELPYRIICMHSIYGDTVLDPFVGTGTSMTAAIAAGRNSIGCDISKELQQTINDSIMSAIKIGRNKISERISRHVEFVDTRNKKGKKSKYFNNNDGLPTITAQEIDLLMYAPTKINKTSDLTYEVYYDEATFNNSLQAEQLSLFVN